MNKEINLKLDFFKETGSIFNIFLKESVDNDRIESIDSNGKVTIYPSLDMVAETMSGGDKSKKADIKFRIRKSIIEQDNKKLYKRYWSENEDDYLIRSQ